MTSGDEVLAPFIPRVLDTWPHPDRIRARTVEGTLTSVDLSGFTRLTERLAATGKGGAEELAAVISRIFTGLSDLAFLAGGDILKFGGDALLILFEGDGHAERAVAATAEMQRSIREAGRVDTALGAVRLRMSVGVHTGRFGLYLTGRGYQALHVVGTDASTTVALESAATAGQVLLSPETAAQIPPAWSQPHDQRSRRARGTVPWPPRRPTVLPRRTPDEPSRFVPPALLDPLRQPGIDGEHRAAVVSFLSAPGTDALERDGGPAAVLARLDLVSEAIDASVERYGVVWLETDVAVDAAKFILVAGAPTASEDDEERLLLAVRDIADACGEHLQIGVNRGPVFLGRVGHPDRRSYSLLGDAMNLSARLMGRAEPGQVIASRAVLDLSRARFETEPLPPFLVKGKRQPIQAALVGDRRGTVAPGADRVALVGREAEVDRLLGAIERAAAGDGGTVEVVGDAGMGKSRLLAEVAARSTARWVHGHGAPYQAATPYAAVRPLLRAALGISPDAPPAEAGERLQAWGERQAPDLAPWLPLLADAMGAEVGPTPAVDRLDPTMVRPRLQEAVVDALRVALDQGTVLLLEDLHWADDASLDLLRRLAAETAARPWCLLATRRGDPEAAVLGEEAAVLDLPPLEAADVDRLAIYAADDLALSDLLLEQIAERADGNPLFIRELVAGLADLAASGVAVGGGVEELPTSIDRLIRSRIDTLTVADRALLRDAAAIGAEAPIHLVAAVGEVPQAADPARWAGLEAFVTVDDAPRPVARFTHDLFRVGAYEGLTYRRRRTLHGRIAEALLDEGGDLDQLAPVLALHFAEADRHPEAWTWAVRSGRAAWVKGAVVEAAEQFARALSAAGHLDHHDRGEVSEVAEALGDATDRLGRFPEAAAAYRRARRSTADPVRTVRLMRKQGLIEEHAGRYTSSLRWYGRALAQLDRLPHGVAGERDAAAARVDLQLAYGVTRFYQGRLRDAAAWALRAAAGAEATGDRAAQAQAHLQLEMAYSELHHPDRARHGALALDLLLELGDDLKLGHLYLNLGVSAYNEGAWDEALDWYARSAEAYGRAGDVVGQASTHNNTAEILTDQGRYAEALDQLELARRRYRGAGYAWGVALTTSGLSRLAVRAGDLPRAHELLDQAEAEFTGLDSAALVLDTRVRQVECLLYERRGDEALARADAVAAELEAFGDVALLPAALARLRGWALVLVDRPDDGRTSFEDARRLARQDGSAFEELLALDALRTLDRMQGRPHAADAERLLTEGRSQLGIVALPGPPTEAQERPG